MIELKNKNKDVTSLQVTGVIRLCKTPLTYATQAELVQYFADAPKGHRMKWVQNCVFNESKTWVVVGRRIFLGGNRNTLI